MLKEVKSQSVLEMLQVVEKQGGSSLSLKMVPESGGVRNKVMLGMAVSVVGYLRRAVVDKISYQLIPLSLICTHHCHHHQCHHHHHHCHYINMVVLHTFDLWHTYMLFKI